jgi:hypothetical protein
MSESILSCPANDSSFSVTTEGVEEAYHAFARLLLSDTHWQKAKKRGKLPDAHSDAQTVSLLRQVIDDRLSRYPASLAVSLSRDAADRRMMLPQSSKVPRRASKLPWLCG